MRKFSQKISKKIQKISKKFKKFEIFSKNLKKLKSFRKKSAISPPLPPGPQDLPRDYGPDGAAGGLSRSTPPQADDTTTRPSGSGPTRQSYDWDSELDYLLRPTRHGPGGTLLDYSALLFRAQVTEYTVGTKLVQRRSLQRHLLSKLALLLNQQ